MSSIKIQLFNENSIGRYYQIAALSVARRLLSNFANEIENGITRGWLTLTPGEFNELYKALVDYIDSSVCKLKPESGPNLYTAGANDRKILNTAGFQVGKTITCKQLVDYFAKGVFEKKFNDDVSVPMFLRPYVFSSYRDGRKFEKINVASLYLALIGIHISLVGRVREADKTYELYIIPDSSLETLKNAHVMYMLLNDPRTKVRITDIIKDFLRLEGVSLELSAILAITLYVYHVAKHVLNLNSLSSYYNVFERFRLVCINPGERPLVVWERVLAITHLIQKLEKLNILDLLETIETLVKLTSKINMKDYSSVISICMNDLYGFLETNVPEPLIRCSSSLSRLYDALNESCREGNNLACSAAYNVSRLLHGIAELKPRRAS